MQACRSSPASGLRPRRRRRIEPPAPRAAPQPRQLPALARPCEAPGKLAGRWRSRHACSDPQRPRAACASELLEGAGARACAPSRPGARTQRIKQVLIPVSGDGRMGGGRTARRAYAATARSHRHSALAVVARVRGALAAACRQAAEPVDRSRRRPELGEPAHTRCV